MLSAVAILVEAIKIFMSNKVDLIGLQGINGWGKIASWKVY